MLDIPSHIQYALPILAISVSIFLLGKKYFIEALPRTDEFNLLYASICLWIYHTSLYGLFIYGEYNSGMVLYSHVALIFSYWFFSLFVLAQTHFKKLMNFKIAKLSIHFIFGMTLSLLLILVTAFNHPYFSLLSLFDIGQQISLLASNKAEVVIDLYCLGTITFFLIYLPKIFPKHRKKIITLSCILLFRYIISLFNATFFDNYSYALFYIDRLLGTFTSSSLIFLILMYLNPKKFTE